MKNKNLLIDRVVGPGLFNLPNLPESERCLWRTLLRRIATDSDGAWIVIPSWNSRLAIRVDNLDFVTWKDDRCHVACNKGCEIPSDLVFAHEKYDGFVL